MTFTKVDLPAIRSLQLVVFTTILESNRWQWHDDDGSDDDLQRWEPVTIAESLHWVIHGAKSAHSKPDILSSSTNVLEGKQPQK